MRHLRGGLLGTAGALDGMDALMAALVAGLLAQIGDRTAWLAAILSDRYSRPFAVVAGATLALAGASAIAATLGAALAPRLTPEAKQLMLGAALMLQGVGAAFATKPPERLETWRLGALATATFGLFVLAFGDGLQFVVFALAARTPLPALAAVGAVIGSLAPVATAAVLGEDEWRRLPLGRLRVAAGVAFVVAGIALGLRALGLV